MHKSQKTSVTLVSSIAVTAALFASAAVYGQSMQAAPAMVAAPAATATPAATVAPAASITAAVAPVAIPATGIPMTSGGVGDAELAAILSVQNQYNLKVLFTEGAGAYLSQVPVRITDATGATVLETITKGPVLLVTLPVGKYTITAMQGTETKEQKIGVGSRGLREAVFRFKSSK